ncbi:pantoate--beta-alanine ligase [Aestuariibacter sp. A3R04]|uniref:pantoate--beta-alanine ligase n=1 Tax=Aestuariibacter sp. A3R04 TaxID=2841571 RepID=UPI001C0A1721|nr:pantoate--beta-alanine ligase [Aestuariibacter sp. A3R04]MBU3023906.1 pantoate--beta-alanine ligase [Aestuariibacter sp. A3R04]
MKTISTVQNLRALRKDCLINQKTVGFVPTMGNLHNGHLQLVRAAKARCDVVVVSIFVNPMQFGENEDLDNYPRTLDADKEKLRSLGVDALFLPSVAEMYPRGLAQQTFVEVPDISAILCGASRPGHFRGVATIVCKLFNMVSPDIAFFGEKDFQQLQVIRLMARDLSMDLNIVGVATERESDGLAMSSRNGYLSKSEREIAPALHQILLSVRQAIASGERSFTSLETRFAAQIEETGFKTDYLVIRNADDLSLPQADTPRLVILVAAYLGSTRLIDNLTVDLSAAETE